MAKQNSIIESIVGSRKPVCPKDSTALGYDGKHVVCEDGHKFGPEGWGFDVTELPDKRPKLKLVK